LRAEVERLREQSARWQSLYEAMQLANSVADSMAEREKRLGLSDSRAERLAEALRSLAANWDERCNTVLRQARDADESEVSKYHITAGALAGCAHELRAALTQEDRNG